MKKIIVILLALLLIFAFTACSNSTIELVKAASESQEDYTDNVVMIMLGDEIIASGHGITIDGSRIAITSPGIYSISGTLDNGQIIVRVEDNEIVELVLNGANITCSNNSPIYINNADEAIITLAEGTQNYVTDGDSYILGDSTADEPNAAIFSKDDLTINGNGSLTVNANYNNGIQSKDDLKITGGNITVNAVNDGIRGRDSITIKDGIITVNATSDGMQSNNDTDPEKGYVTIESGTINITAGNDGIQAETSLLISGGNITISSGGGSANGSKNAGNRQNMPSPGNWNLGNNPDISNPDNRQNMPPGNWDMENNSDSSNAASAKGLKAGVNITITGGAINIDSSDDSINSNESLTINSGNIILAAGDDGIHSDSAAEINGGDISITKCYEGIESAAVTINDGNIQIVSSDDGINVVGGTEGFPMGGRPMQNEVNISADIYLNINGGYLAIDAGGDGIDVGSAINMTGGTVIVNGPTANDNGALDYVACKVTGGFLIAVGSSGMAQAPGTSSTQYSVMYNFSSAQSANTIVHLETEDGEELLTFVPTKTYQSVVLSSPDLKNGMTCIVYSGGSSTGTVIDSLYSGGTYTAGTKIDSFTISSVVTRAGSSAGGFPGGAGNPGDPGVRMPPGGMRQ